MESSLRDKDKHERRLVRQVKRLNAQREHEETTAHVDEMVPTADPLEDYGDYFGIDDMSDW